MVYNGTEGAVADNSGAKRVEVFGILGGTGKRKSYLGEIVQVAVKQAVPNMPVKAGETYYAILVRSTYKTRRSNGSVVKSNENAFVLLSKNKKELIGNRIFGYVLREVVMMHKKIQKFISACKEVI